MKREILKKKHRHYGLMDEKHIELEPFIVSSRSFLMFPYLGVVTEIKSNSLSVFYLVHTNSVLVHNLKVTNSKSYSLCNNRLHESTYWKLAGNYLVHYDAFWRYAKILIRQMEGDILQIQKIISLTIQIGIHLYLLRH